MDGWYNNEIGKRLYEEYRHDFSVCDIDGVCRKFYKQNNSWNTRLVIYESKHENEEISDTQLNTLYVLDKSIDWRNFDKYSGIFLIKHNENLSQLELNKIVNVSETIKPRFELNYIKTIDMDGFYNWISCKDVDNG
jgi:hypothetical protein